MKKIVLLVAVFFTGLSFSLTDKEIAEKIRKGSVENALRIISKSTVLLTCRTINYEKSCFVRSGSKEQFDKCIDSIRANNQIKSLEKQLSFLLRVISEEERRRPEEFNAYEKKVVGLIHLTDREIKSYFATTYIDEMGMISKVFSLANKTKGLLESSNSLIQKCNFKFGEDKFNCFKQAIPSEVRTLEKTFSCSKL